MSELSAPEDRSALARLGAFAVRRRGPVLLATAGLLVLAALLGGGGVARLSTGGWVDPGGESTRAAQLLEERLAGGEPNYLLLLTAPPGVGVDDPRVAAVGEQVAAELAADPGVSRTVSYWGAGRPPALRSLDGRSALVTARLAGDEDEVKETAGELSARLAGERSGVVVEPGGSAEVYRTMGEVAEADLTRAELVALPLTFVALVLVLGTAVAAGLALAVGVVAILGTLLVLAVLTALTDVSVFALNLTTALGLGLAIDYSLFVIGRYREELAAGRPPHDAVVAAVASAGRTVVFSAVTVALSLAALLVFPLYFLRSFAYAGVAVVTLAALSVVVVLPALLALLGRRVEALPVRRTLPGRHERVTDGSWGRLAAAVMRRPVPVATAAAVLLLALGSPFLGARFALTDDRALPAEEEVAAVHAELRERFDAGESDPLTVVAAQPLPAPETAAYAARLSALPGVARVDAATGSYAGGTQVAAPSPAGARLADADATSLSVVLAVEGMSPEAEDVVHAVRGEPAPAEFLVSGSAARLVDTRDVIGRLLPLAAGVIAGSVGALLFLFTGGVLVPVKALVLNLLSLSATFGVLVWGFQEGNLAGLLGFTVTGSVDIAVPVLLFCVAFGLSMDYEVFLLSRMREEWERTGDNTAAVVAGVARTGSIITSAAVLVSIVFLSFATSGITSLTMLGIGLTVAVLVDATVVRGLLVPAFMRLAGPANWWAPAPLRRAHDRLGLREAPHAGPPLVPAARSPEEPAGGARTATAPTATATRAGTA